LISSDGITWSIVNGLPDTGSIDSGLYNVTSTLTKQ
jgi:hypothetical protein